jgi:hypothetical protein
VIPYDFIIISNNIPTHIKGIEDLLSHKSVRECAPSMWGMVHGELTFVLWRV